MADRKAARWTNDASFRYTECAHNRLLSTSPETYFHKGEPFRKGSADLLVIDCGIEQDFEKFLSKIVIAMGVEGTQAVVEEGAIVEPVRSLNDKALYMARQFFRETV